MRREKIDYIADALFWFLVLILPIITFLLHQKWNIDVPTFNYINNISSVFKTIFNTYFGFTAPDKLYWFMSYGVMVQIMHVFYDFLSFFPRWCHKLMDKFYNVGGVK